MKMNQEITDFALEDQCAKKVSNVQPVWYFVILSIATLSLYNNYWFYRNWKHLKFHKKLNISPLKRTLGLIVPIYNIYIVYDQFYMIRNFARDVGINKLYAPGWMGAIFCVACIASRLPDPYYLLGFLSIMPLAIAQGVLNSYWKREQPGYQMKTKLYLLGEFVVVVICATLFWAASYAIWGYIF